MQEQDSLCRSKCSIPALCDGCGPLAASPVGSLPCPEGARPSGGAANCKSAKTSPRPPPRCNSRPVGGCPEASGSLSIPEAKAVVAFVKLLSAFLETLLVRVGKRSALAGGGQQPPPRVTGTCPRVPPAAEPGAGGRTGRAPPGPPCTQDDVLLDMTTLKPRSIPRQGHASPATGESPEEERTQRAPGERENQHLEVEGLSRCGKTDLKPSCRNRTCPTCSECSTACLSISHGCNNQFSGQGQANN
ncbi:uncharacterized protein LOC116965741 isoform X2 [Tyto alba]|uniref:uncharacterized protein LOC116965741 isoform X2 n=1 Tax=Tyto alba TaxID=56313 RepID=UPI001C67BE45|nr:uncharacterized protein LOC116965741 isoform X2 [Tyto alba]